MARRTKEELVLMKQMVTAYLVQNEMNTHKAHEALVKKCLMNNTPIPYYIKGVKDFEKVAKEIQQKEEAEKIENNIANNYQAEKKNAIEFLMESDAQQIKHYYSSIKEGLSQKERHSLLEWLMFKNAGDYKESYISVELLNVIRNNLSFEDIA